MKKKRPFIIAEIGINFEGKMSLAKKLISEAKKCRVNAVKFQLFKAETLASKKSKKTKDQERNIKKENLFNMWKRMELNEKKLFMLKRYAKKNKLDFILSVFDFDSFKLAEKVGVDYFKVASSELNNSFLLENISKTNKKVIISTGMSTEDEIKKCLKIFNLSKVHLLHCVSLYPCPENKVNLRRMIKLKKFGCKVGYSDHCKGINASISAISMGCEMLEKHFTYNNHASGADHEISADTLDMTKISDFAENFILYKGNGEIEPTKNEMKMKKFFRKSLYYNKNLKLGKKLNISDISFLRPQIGLEIKHTYEILSKKLNKDVYKGELIKFRHFI